MKEENLNALEVLKPIKDLTKYRNYVISFGGLLFCIVFFTIFTDGRLWSTFNIGIVIEAVTVYAILAMGAMFIYSMGNMDISVGAQMGVYSILIILITNATKSLSLAFLTVLLIACFSACFNAIVSTWLGLPAIVTSIFLSFIFSGIQLLIMEKGGVNTISIEQDIHFWLRTDVMVISMVLVGILSYLLFHYTIIGKYASMIGSNIVATEICGINTLKAKIYGFVIFGTTIAISALFLTARTGSAGRGTGNGYAMDIMIILILGGMPLSGGVVSKMVSSIVGALTFVLLSNGLTLMGLSSAYGNVIKAIVFMIVILITSRKKDGVLPR